MSASHKACGASTQYYLQGKPCLPDENPCRDPSVVKVCGWDKWRRAPRLGMGASGSGKPRMLAATLPGCACNPGAVPAQAALSSSAAICSSRSLLKTLNCGSQPLSTRTRAIPGAFPWSPSPFHTSSFDKNPMARMAWDLVSAHSANRCADMKKFDRRLLVQYVQ